MIEVRNIQPVTRPMRAIFVDQNATEVVEWVRANGGIAASQLDDYGSVWIRMLDNSMAEIRQGWWLIQDGEEFRPCAPSIFRTSYVMI